MQAPQPWCVPFLAIRLTPLLGTHILRWKVFGIRTVFQVFHLSRLWNHNRGSGAIHQHHFAVFQRLDAQRAEIGNSHAVTRFGHIPFDLQLAGGRHEIALATA